MLGACSAGLRDGALVTRTDGDKRFLFRDKREGVRIGHWPRVSPHAHIVDSLDAARALDGTVPLVAYE